MKCKFNFTYFTDLVLDVFPGKKRANIYSNNESGGIFSWTQIYNWSWQIEIYMTSLNKVMLSKYVWLWQMCGTQFLCKYSSSASKSFSHTWNGNLIYNVKFVTSHTQNNTVMLQHNFIFKYINNIQQLNK